MEISDKNGGGKKTVIKTTKYSMQRIYTTFELGHTMVPYGVRTQGHAEGYQPEGKNPQIATKEEHTACTGV